jgi:hypothetical protein
MGDGRVEKNERAGVFSSETRVADSWSEMMERREETNGSETVQSRMRICMTLCGGQEWSRSWQVNMWHHGRAFPFFFFCQCTAGSDSPLALGMACALRWEVLHGLYTLESHSILRR